MTSRFELLDTTAPDVVGAWNGVAAGRPIEVRREARRRAGAGSAPRVAQQLAAVAEALASVVSSLPEEAFAMAGGETDWNVAQALGHTAEARAQLALAASLAAAHRWPPDAPAVLPGVPGAGEANRAALLHRIALSQRIIERSVRTIAGHETDACPLAHPLVGRLRCGEWLLFAGVHDLMHLEQLEALEARLR